MFRSRSLSFGMLSLACFTPLTQAAAIALPWLSEEKPTMTQALGAQGLADKLDVASGPANFNANAPLQTGTLELREAVAIAVNRHPSIISAASAIAQQEGAVDYAKAGYYPKITAGVNSAELAPTATAR